MIPDVEELEKIIKEKRKSAMSLDIGFIISVFLLGFVCDMNTINELLDFCKDHLLQQDFSEIEIQELIYNIKKITGAMQEGKKEGKEAKDSEGV